jgi:hypothetical protein
MTSEPITVGGYPSHADVTGEHASDQRKRPTVTGVTGDRALVTPVTITARWASPEPDGIR